MTPPCYTFPASELSERIQLDVHGRQRKMPFSHQAATHNSVPQVIRQPSPEEKGRTQEPKGPQEAALPGDQQPRQSASRHSDIDLVRDCELLSSLVQYSCAVMHPEMRGSPVRCWPVQRMFRRCQDRHGVFTVETTAWESTYGTGPMPGRDIEASKTPPSDSRTEAFHHHETLGASR